jgi:hypothetical protein
MIRICGGDNMFESKSVLAAVLLIGLLVLGVAGWVEAGGGKQLMLVFTTDTGGELNPCG